MKKFFNTAQRESINSFADDTISERCCGTSLAIEVQILRDNEQPFSLENVTVRFRDVIRR